MPSSQDPIHETKTEYTAPGIGCKCVLYSLKFYISVDCITPVTHTLHCESPIITSTLFSLPLTTQ